MQQVQWIIKMYRLKRLTVLIVNFKIEVLSEDVFTVDNLLQASS